MIAAFVLVTVVMKLGVPPKSTVRPGAKPRPVSVTVVPPACGPVSGVTDTSRGLSRYTKPPARLADGPPGSVTVTVTGPAWNCGAGGTSIVRVVGVAASTFTCCAPSRTTSPTLNPVPVMMAVVVASAKPNDGESAETRGCCAVTSEATSKVPAAGTASGRNEKSCSPSTRTTMRPGGSGAAGVNTMLAPRVVN